MFLRLLCVSGLRYFGVWGFDLVVGVCACRLVGFLLFSGVWAWFRLIVVDFFDFLYDYFCVWVWGLAVCCLFAALIRS